MSHRDKHMLLQTAWQLHQRCAPTETLGRCNLELKQSNINSLSCCFSGHGEAGVQFFKVNMLVIGWWWKLLMIFEDYPAVIDSFIKDGDDLRSCSFARTMTDTSKVPAKLQDLRPSLFFFYEIVLFTCCGSDKFPGWQWKCSASAFTFRIHFCGWLWAELC